MREKTIASLIIAAALCATTSGCGSSDDRGAWTGTWVSTASQQEVCPTGSHTTPLDGSLTIGDGADGELVTMPPNGCDLTWTVAGSLATLKANQTCTVPGSVGGTWMPTFTSGTMSLAGTVITLGDEGSATLTITTTQTCSFTQSGPFTKS